MGYVVRHSTSNINKARRKGNVALGVSSDGYDKTSVSGFYAGVEPVEGKHNLVRTSASGDPDFYALTDTELINFANQLGGSVSTIREAQKYLIGQNDVIFLDELPKNTVMSDLVIDLDASVEASFLDNQPTTNLITYPTMLPTNSGSVISSNSTSHSNVGGSGWSWTYYPNSNISSDGGMVWVPNVLDPLGEQGAWLMKKRPGGNSESNWYSSAPGAIDSTKSYTISTWCKTTQGSCFRIHINTTKDGSSYWGYGSSYHTGDGNWQLLSVTIPANSGNTSINVIRCQAVGTSVTADAYWKYYQCEDGDVATDFVDGSRLQNTTWYDLSGNNHNVTLENQPTFNPNGYISFDGVDQRGTQSGLPAVDLTTDYYTMEVLCKFPTLPAKQITDSGTGGGPIYGRRMGSDYILFAYASSSAGESNLGVSYDDSRVNANHRTNAAIKANEWVRFTHVGIPYYDGSYWRGKFKYYVNGELDHDETVSSDSNGYSISTTFYLAYDERWGDYGKVDIASIKRYNRELTAEEVKQNYYGGDIVTDGLVLAMDAGNLVSYESGSTVAYNLTGSISGSLVNGVEYSSYNNGAWNFDGTDDRITLTTTQYTTTEPWTILFWVNFDDLTKHTHLTGVPTLDPGGWAPLSHYGAGLADYKQAWWDSNGWRYSSTSLSENTWHQVGLYYDGDNTIGFILDGQYDNATTGGGTFNPIARIGAFGYRQHNNDRYFDGKIGNINFYTKQLSESEILQNYNAHKARFL